MAFFHQRPEWYLPDSKATPEGVYFNRRAILRAIGLGGLALAGGPLVSGCSPNPGTSDENNASDASTTKDASSQGNDRSGSSNLPTDPKKNYDPDATGKIFQQHQITT